MSRPTLDGHTLIEVSQTGFDYPARTTVVPLLGSDPDAGFNAVLQSSARTFREVSIRFLLASLADVDAIRAIYEDVESVVYVDHYGNDHQVAVIEFSAAGLGADWWTCSATLAEIAEPEEP